MAQMIATRVAPRSSFLSFVRRKKSSTTVSTRSNVAENCLRQPLDTRERGESCKANDAAKITQRILTGEKNAWRAVKSSAARFLK